MRILSLFVLLLLLPAASALPATGGPLTTQDMTLYTYYSQERFWMSTASSEPNADDPGGFGLGSAATDNTWTILQEPANTYDVVLDAGAVRMIAWIGSTSNQRAGVFDATMTLSLDGAVVATGTAERQTFANGEYAEVIVEATAAATDLPAGSQLQWDIEVSGVFQGIFLRHGDESRPTRIELPVISDVPVPEAPRTTAFIDVTGPAFDENATFEGDDHDTQYNWTFPATDLLGFYIINGSGQVDITILQGGATLAHWALDGDQQDSFAFNGTVDAAHVHVNVTGFTGSYHLVIEEDAPVTTQEDDDGPQGGGAPSQTTTEPGETTSETEGSGETSATDEPGEESPGLAILSTMALLGAIAYLRRR